LQPGCARFSCISCTTKGALQHQLLRRLRGKPGPADIGLTSYPDNA
jgi:hypothetical protein